MKTNSIQKRLFTVSATAIGALGMLTTPVAAHADPTACPAYKFNGPFSLKQSNGWTVDFNATGQAVQSKATSRHGSQSGTGSAAGSIKDRHIEFTITWANGATGRYVGDVDDSGFAHGRTTDHASPEQATWDATIPLACAAPPVVEKAPPFDPGKVTQPPPARSHPPIDPGDLQKPAPPAGPTGPATATVISHVDVYNVKNEPDGAGHVIGMLNPGTQVQLVGTCQLESWCQVSGPNVPAGNGWVWGHLKF